MLGLLVAMRDPVPINSKDSLVLLTITHIGQRFLYF